MSKVERLLERKDKVLNQITVLLDDLYRPKYEQMGELEHNKLLQNTAEELSYQASILEHIYLELQGNEDTDE